MKKHIQRYGYLGLIKLMLNVLTSKLIFSQARIIRRPCYIRGKRFIEVGKNFTSGVGLRLDGFSENNKVCIKIGDDVQLNDYVHIGATEFVMIGNNVLIGSKVLITDHNHGFYGAEGKHSNPDSKPLLRELSTSPVVIEDNVWIGEHVCILPGTTIGKGSVIGAMSVVSGTIPEYSLAVGSPAKVRKIFNFESGKWEVTEKTL